MDETNIIKNEEGDLFWVGVLETCDLCGYEYCLSWVEFNGIQFLCLSCRTEYKEKYEEKEQKVP